MIIKFNNYFLLIRKQQPFLIYYIGLVEALEFRQIYFYSNLTLDVYIISQPFVSSNIYVNKNNFCTQYCISDYYHKSFCNDFSFKTHGTCLSK